MIRLTVTPDFNDSFLQEEVGRSYDRLLSREDVGFFRLHQQESLWQGCSKWAQDFRNRFDQLVIVGIGGSSLGIRVIQEVFAGKAQKESKQLHFLDNVDPLVFQDLMSSSLNWERTGWVILSKSGKTLETLTLANFVAQELRKKNLSLAERSLVISEEKSNPLNQWADDHEVPRLEIPENVGGRFSVLSPVGMFPAAFLGLSLSEFRRSIPEFLENSRSLVENLVMQTVGSFERQELVTMFWFYCRSMKEFGAWLEQLWAESLPKKKTQTGERNRHNRQVSTPLSCIGTSDQHSLLQQVMEGRKDKFVWFLRFQDVEKIDLKLAENIFAGQDFLQGRSLADVFAAEAMATRLGMEQVGVPCLELMVDQVDEFHLGQMFMLFEMIVGVLGEFYQINAFDQPGVEIGKKLTLDFLQREAD